jgi:hypothetical protein
MKEKIGDFPSINLQKMETALLAEEEEAAQEEEQEEYTGDTHVAAR